MIFRKYFASTKGRGFIENQFFDSINEGFVCLFASAMRHGLNLWRTGLYVEPTRSNEFPYESCVGMFIVSSYVILLVLKRKINKDRNVLTITCNMEKAPHKVTRTSHNICQVRNSLKNRKKPFSGWKMNQKNY